MQTQTLGLSDLVSTRISYGCMRISGTWDPAQYSRDLAAGGRRAALTAYEAGITLFDHADIYGGGTCETVFRDVLREAPEMRERIIIATKCGIRFPNDSGPGVPHRYDFSREHILESVDGSLSRMGIETIDLLQLHRPDYLCNPAEVAEAFEQLKQQGKVRWFGVSNFSPSQYTALQRACSMPLVVNQVEIHLRRLDCLSDGTLDQCLAEKVTPLAWSPLAGGLLGDGGAPPADHPQREGIEKLLALLDELANGYGVSRTCMALAWLMKHPSGIIPIIGTLRPERIIDAAKAENVPLSREDWYRLLVAARMKPLP